MPQRSSDAITPPVGLGSAPPRFCESDSVGPLPVVIHRKPGWGPVINGGTRSKQRPHCSEKAAHVLLMLSAAICAQPQMVDDGGPVHLQHPQEIGQCRL